MSSESSDDSSSESEHEQEKEKDTLSRHVTYTYNADRPEDFRSQNQSNHSYSSHIGNKIYFNENRLERQKTLSENSMDFSYSNNNSNNNNNSLGRNSAQDDYTSEEFTRTERSDSEKVSFMADKSQPKVSTSSLINHEIVRSNRITTLMNAVSNSSQYPVLGNKKSHTFISTHPLPKSSIRPQKQISLDMNSIADSTTVNMDETTSNDIVNANTVNTSETAGINLLKQIEQHQTKQNVNKTKTKHNTSKQSNSENHIRNNINSISNKDV